MADVKEFGRHSPFNFVMAFGLVPLGMLSVPPNSNLLRRRSGSEQGVR
jgi:hypothetical protein